MSCERPARDRASGPAARGGAHRRHAGAWTLTAPNGPDGWTFTGALAQADDFWLDAGYPLDLLLEFGGSVFRAPGVTVAIDEARSTVECRGTSPFEKA